MAQHINTMDMVRALRRALAKSREEYENALRKMPLGDGPIFVVADGPGYLAAQTAALSFEHLAGRPCLGRSFAEFSAYDLPLLRPHTPVLAISVSGTTEPAVEILVAAKRRGAWLAVLTQDPRNPLATVADEFLPLRLDAEDRSAAQNLISVHAVAGSLGLYAGLIFKPHQSQRESHLAQLEELPDHLDHVFSHSSNAAREMIEEIRRLHRILILGCGFSRPAAAQGAAWLEAALGRWTLGGSPSEFPVSIPDLCNEGTGIIFLSGSQSPHKKLIHQLAEEVEQKNPVILAISDGGDSGIIRRSKLSILIPSVHEMPAAVLQMALLQWMASLAGRPTPQVAGTGSGA